MWREIGRERERREETREGIWKDDGDERDFLMERGRVEKESLVDFGSRRDWRARKVSRPWMGAETAASGWRAAVAIRIRRRMAGDIFGV